MKSWQHSYWFPIACFAGLAYLLSWIIWFPLYAPQLSIEGLPVFPYHHAYGAIGPFAAAFITTYIFQDQNAVQELSSRLIRWKVGVKWHTIAWMAPFVLLILALLINSLSQGKAIELSGMGVSREFSEFGLVIFVLYNIFSFGYGEETGWRGFYFRGYKPDTMPCGQASFSLSSGQAGIFRYFYTGLATPVWKWQIVSAGY